MLPASYLSARYHETGKPEEVVQIDELPLSAPAAGEVVLKLICAVINPSDLGMMGGSYGRLREMPAVAGREGIGEVVAVGEGVSLKIGQRIRMPEEPGAWQQYATVLAEGLVTVPDNVPVEQAAMAFVNPSTSYRLLKDFGNLQSGDWVMQNAANSAVGFAVIQLAKKWGYKTINVVRDVAKWEGPLTEAGADVVVAEGEPTFKTIKDLCGGAKPKLGLNSIGGNSVINIIRCMADGGEVITFGGMVGDAVRFPTRNLIFNDVALRGYWMDKWMRTRSLEEIQAFMDDVFVHMVDGTIKLPIAETYALKDIKEALIAAQKGNRNGKVLIKPE